MIGEKDEFLLSLDDVSNDDINSYLKKWRQIDKLKKVLEGLDERLRTKIRVFLKERNWDRYNDSKGTKISVSITTQKREKIDKEQLHYILNESQLAQVTSITTFERLSIITPEARQRLKKYVKKDYGKNKGKKK